MLVSLAFMPGGIISVSCQLIRADYLAVSLLSAFLLNSKSKLTKNLCKLKKKLKK